MTDYIGIRAIHLYKSDLKSINDFISSKWKLYETPKAYVREGDSEDYIRLYEEGGCKIDRHKFGYRSVHYVIESHMYRQKRVAEIQVRTIFEEGWSEIDHITRYPYDLNNPILAPYLLNFNILAGLADNMGTYINYLMEQLNQININHKKAIDDKNKDISELKDQIAKLEVDDSIISELLEKIDKLEQESTLRSSPGGRTLIAPYPLGLMGAVSRPYGFLSSEFADAWENYQVGGLLGYEFHDPDKKS